MIIALAIVHLENMFGRSRRYEKETFGLTREIVLVLHGVAVKHDACYQHLCDLG